MAYTTINKSTDYFNTKLYTGNGSTNAITGVNFQPDWTWLKRRDTADSHALYDAVRGVTKRLESNGTGAEGTKSAGLTTFGTDGFTLGNDTQANTSGGTYASWNWKANGAGSANTDGSINSTVSANTTSGFSIVSFTGTGSNATVGHGLGVAPKFIIVKCLSHASEWIVYYGDATDYLKFNEDNATADDSTRWNDTAPTNSVFSLGTQGDINTSGRTYIAYCFAEKKGYSKIGSYTGNGNNDGTFVYTGFKPAWVMVKRTDGSANWNMYDNKRIGYNPLNYFLYPNLSDAEDTSNPQWLDLHSNGFKLRNTSAIANTSGGSYIYMAFGQSLVGSNNVPCTAR
jgi:hypothetical protein